MTKPQVRELSECELAKALRASIDAEKLLAWNALGVNDRAKVCGMPFGLGDRTYAPWPYKRSFEGASTCGMSTCPQCGRETALRRWALITLLVARHLAAGGSAWFVSVAGAHRRDEATRDKLHRLKTVLAVFGLALRHELRHRVGVTGWVRVLEATFGGPNGTHPNAHYLMLCDDREVPGPVNDEGGYTDRGHWLEDELRSSLLAWAVGRTRGRFGSKLNLERCEVLTKFSSDIAIDVRPAGVDVASYLGKLEAGADEVAGVGFELTDPVGQKSRQGVGDKGWTGWAIRRARAAGYGGRKFKAGLRLVPELRQTAEEFREWIALTKRMKMYATSEGVMAQFEGMSTDELLREASKVADAEDWQAVLRVLGLADEEPEPDPTSDDDGPGDGPGPFDDDAPVEPPPAPPTEVVRLDALALAAWFEDFDEPTFLGGIDGLAQATLTREGPWRTMLTIAESALRIDERRLAVWERVDPDEEDPPQVWLTAADEDLGTGGWWEPLSWDEVRLRAKRTARWVRPQVMAVKARAA